MNRPLRLLSSLLLLLSFAGTAYAQATGSVEGRITDASSGEPLAYANVVVQAEGVERGSSTDARGRYRIGDLPPGAYRLTVSIVGYAKESQRVIIEAGEVRTVDLQLTPRRYGMDEIVVSAVRSETTLGTVPSSVTVLGTEELDRQRALTGDLGAILSQKVPGLAPSSGTLSNYGQTLRGRTPLILIDGVPQSTPLRAASRALRTIDPSAIERIEVIRGASALYGYGAAGGAINIITKRPAPGAVNLTTEVGTRFSFRNLSESFSGDLLQRVSGRTGRVDYLLSGTYSSWGYFYDAEGDLIPQNPHGQGGLANADEVNVLAKAGLQLTSDQRLGISVNYYDFKQDMEYVRVAGEVGRQKATAEPAEEVRGKDPGTQNLVATLTYAHADVAGSRVEARAYLQDYETRFGYYTYYPGGGQPYVRSTKFGARLDVETPVPLTPGAALRWGLDLLRDETAQPLVDGRVYVPPITQVSAAPFAQLKLPIGERFVLRGGARYELIGLSVDDYTTLFPEIDTDGDGTPDARNTVEGGALRYDALVFNAGGVAHLTRRLDLFASFAQGFSVADVGRVLRGTTARSFEQLQPEAQKVNSYEVGLRFGAGRVRASLVGFVSTSELGSTYGDLPELELIRSPERIRGIEATLDLQPAPDLQFGGTFTYLKGKRDATGDDAYETYLPGARIPPMKITGYVAYAPIEGWQNRLQVLYSGNRDRFAGSDAFGQGAVDNFTTVDFYSAVPLGPGTLQLGIENVLNTFYFPTISQWYNLPIAYSAAPGRQVSLTYTLRW